MPIKAYTDTGALQSFFKGIPASPFKSHLSEKVRTSRMKIGGPCMVLSKDDFSIETSPDQADVAILPMAWNYYMENGISERALAFYKEAQKEQPTRSLAGMPGTLVYGFPISKG